MIWRRAPSEEKRKLAGEGDSLSWVKERKTGSSWEDSLKRKKFGEQNRGTGRERERGAGKEGLKKDFQQKGFSGFSRYESESIFN